MLVVDLPQGDEFHFKLAQLALDMEMNSPSVQKSNKVGSCSHIMLYTHRTLGHGGTVAYLIFHCYHSIGYVAPFRICINCLSSQLWV